MIEHRARRYRAPRATDTFRQRRIFPAGLSAVAGPCSRRTEMQLHTINEQLFACPRLTHFQMRSTHDAGALLIIDIHLRILYGIGIPEIWAMPRVSFQQPTCSCICALRAGLQMLA
jgi:hypothetical protein